MSASEEKSKSNFVEHLKETTHIVTKDGDEQVSISAARIGMVITSIAVAFATSRITRTRTLAGKPAMYGFF